MEQILKTSLAITHRSERLADLVASRTKVTNLECERGSANSLEIVEIRDALFIQSLRYSERYLSWDTTNCPRYRGNDYATQGADDLRSRYDKNRPAGTLYLRPPDLSLARDAHQGSSLTNARVAESSPSDSLLLWGKRA